MECGNYVTYFKYNVIICTIKGLIFVGGYFSFLN